jgi:hypothetical protein
VICTTSPWQPPGPRPGAWAARAAELVVWGDGDEAVVMGYASTLAELGAADPR